MNRQLRDTFEVLGRTDVQDVVDRRRDIDDVVVLMPDPTGVLNVSWPVHDKRRSHAAAMHMLLVPLQRRVGGLRPAGRIVIVSHLAADAIDERQRRLYGLLLVDHMLAQMNRTRRSTFGARSVIRKKNDQSVLQLPDSREVVDQPSDLGVGMLEKASICLLQARKEPSRVVGMLLPRHHVRIWRRERGSWRDQFKRKLFAKPLFADRVPALIVATGIAFDIFFRHMMWPMAGAERQVGEEWTTDTGTQVIADISDGVIDEIGAQVVIVRPFELDRTIVLAEFGMPLVGQCAMKSVPAIEALPERPVVVWTGRAVVRNVGQVPFAGRVARVCVRAQDLGNHGCRPAHLSLVTGEAAGPFGDYADAYRVRIATRQQTSSGRRAHRGDVEI